MSLFSDLQLTLVLLLVLQRFGPRQWGEISELTSSEHSILLHPINEDGKLGGESHDISFHPEDRIHSGWSILGRATTVIGASDGGEASQQVEGTGSQDAENGKGDEQPTLDQVRDYYQKARDAIFKAHGLVLKISWPEVSRVPEWQIVAHAQTLGEVDEFIRGHVPKIKYGRDLSQYSTQHIRDFLDLQQEKQSGTRTLRLIVMDRLHPLHDLNGEQLWNTFWQCFLCKPFPGRSVVPS